jgi:hypothetical protein
MPGTVRPSPCSISACRLVAGATLLGLLPATCAWAGPAHVDQAVLLLRGGCALDNANLDMSTGNDGRLYLQLSVAGTPRARTSLVYADVERFTDVTLKLQAEQSLAMSACMGQAVNRIIGTLLSLPPDVASLPLNPAPATAAAANGGGYVPPMLPQSSAPPPVVAAVVTQAPSPAMATTGDSSGPLRLSFATVEINPERYSSWNGHLRGTVGIDIFNSTNGMLRVAIIDPWPVVQLDGGLSMSFKSITGVAVNRNANVSNCSSYASQFTTLRPGQTLVTSAVFDLQMGGRDAPNVSAGRVSGELVVLDESANRCTVEPLSASRVNVRMNR